MFGYITIPVYCVKNQWEIITILLKKCVPLDLDYMFCRKQVDGLNVLPYVVP